MSAFDEAILCSPNILTNSLKPYPEIGDANF